MITLEEKSDYCPKCLIGKWLLKKQMSLPGRRKAKFQCPLKPAFKFPKSPLYTSYKYKYNLKNNRI